MIVFATLLQFAGALMVSFRSYSTFFADRFYFIVTVHVCFILSFCEERTLCCLFRYFPDKFLYLVLLLEIKVPVMLDNFLLIKPLSHDAYLDEYRKLLILLEVHCQRLEQGKEIYQESIEKGSIVFSLRRKKG